MRRSLRLALLLFVALQPEAFAGVRRHAAAPPNPGAPFPTAAVERVALDAIQQGVPGMSVAVSSGGRTLFAGAYGVEALDTRVPATTGTIFEIASVTKQFTAAGIMRLVELGKIQVDDPLERYVPQFAGRGILLRHLLTHTSGLPQANFITNVYTTISQESYLTQLSAIPNEFAPGTNWAYRNTGFYLLAVVIEKASGQPFPRFLDDQFFLPLGMTSTAVCGSRPGVPSPRGHMRLASGPTIVVNPPDPSIFLGAGDLCSTATDLVRWNNALAHGSAVSQESYAQMTQATVATGYPWRYGYGLILDHDRGNPTVEHDGLLLGFQSFLLYYPEQDLTTAVLTNAMDDQLEWVPATDAGFAIGRLLVPAK
jgi:D-alanyl-D-alanine carboxypeptidase